LDIARLFFGRLWIAARMTKGFIRFRWLKVFHGDELPLYQKNNLSIISKGYG